MTRSFLSKLQINGHRVPTLSRPCGGDRIWAQQSMKGSNKLHAKAAFPHRRVFTNSCGGNTAMGTSAKYRSVEPSYFGDTLQSRLCELFPGGAVAILDTAAPLGAMNRLKVGPLGTV